MPRAVNAVEGPFEAGLLRNVEDALSKIEPYVDPRLRARRVRCAPPKRTAPHRGRSVREAAASPASAGCSAGTRSRDAEARAGAAEKAKIAMASLWRRGPRRGRARRPGRSGEEGGTEARARSGHARREQRARQAASAVSLGVRSQGGLVSRALAMGCGGSCPAWGSVGAVFGVTTTPMLYVREVPPTRGRQGGPARRSGRDDRGALRPRPQREEIRPSSGRWGARCCHDPGGATFST
jgi:hypothetical protein